MARANECKDLASLVSLLLAVGSMIGQTTSPVLVEATQALYMASKHTAPITTLVGSGIELEDFAAERAYMPRQQLLPHFARLLPNAKKLPTNEEQIEEFLLHRRNRSPDSLEQYKHRLTHFSNYLEKSFFYADSDIIAEYVEEVATELVPGEGFVTVDTVHDQVIDILKNFYKWASKKSYFTDPRGIPVHIQKKGNRNRDPDPSHILSPEQIQMWLDAVEWDDLPYLIFSVKLGIRSETIPRLSWSDVKWDLRKVDIERSKSKCGRAEAPITDEIWEMLKPYRHMVGPIIFHVETPKRVRDVAKGLGIVTRFHNNGRKSAISYCYQLAKEEFGEEKARGLMNTWFGNSKSVRDAWYYCPQPLPRAVAFRACKKAKQPDLVITHTEARRYLGSQYAAFVRQTLALKRKKGNIRYGTERQIIDDIADKAFEMAKDLYGTTPSLPDFVKIASLPPTGRVMPLFSGRRKPPKGFNVLLPPKIALKLSVAFEPSDLVLES